jgi:hypothetical protein
MFLATLSGSTDTKSDVARICAADFPGVDAQRLAPAEWRSPDRGPASSSVGGRTRRRLTLKSGDMGNLWSSARCAEGETEEDSSCGSQFSP